MTDKATYERHFFKITPVTNDKKNWAIFLKEVISSVGQGQSGHEVGGIFSFQLKMQTTKTSENCKFDKQPTSVFSGK